MRTRNVTVIFIQLPVTLKTASYIISNATHNLCKSGNEKAYILQNVYFDIIIYLPKILS